MDPLDMNIMEPESDSLLTPAPPVKPAPIPQAPKPVEYRSFGDPIKTRQNIYGSVLNAFKTLPPVSNSRHTLRLVDVDYQDPETFSKKQQKMAILNNLSLGRRVRGTWELVDNATNAVVDRKQSVIATVPFLTERGTIINKGNEYTVKNQARLLPGVYTREQANGDLESHVNVLPGKGVSHRYYFDPEKGQFRIKLGQGTASLAPLIKAMGVDPKRLQEAWGRDIFVLNYNSDDAADYKKIKHAFLSAKELEGDENQQRQALIKKFEGMAIDPYVTKRTLGREYSGITPDALVDITTKLLRVSRGEDKTDDRDALNYQQFVGPEDLFAERIARDKDGMRRQLLWKASAKGNLQGLPSSALSKQLQSVLLNSGMGQAVEEINPAELYDKMTGITRLGEGGIPSMDAVPMESRSVHPTMFGFLDPLRTPESGKVGVDTYFSRNAHKGSDGKLYGQFRNLKTGQLEYKTPQDMSDTIVGFPGSRNARGNMVPAFVKGEMDYVPKNKIQYELPDPENAFNQLSNIIPMKSQVKGQREVMASRMTTQALPIANAEAPLVQSAVPGTNGTQSFEELYANQMGALRAAKGGVVHKVDDDGIHVRYDDGTQEVHELYNNFPWNRKTGITQTPVVQPGDKFQPNQLLAKSNFTDSTGATALGLNARVAYMAWQGKNFEDAVVVSESFAKRAASEHMYQHQLELNENTKLGKKTYLQAFPGTFDKKTLAKLDDNGVIKVGTEVDYGDPLVLGITEKQAAYNKVHRKGSAGHSDATVTWDHHDRGVVTDVTMTKGGPVVLVKALSETKVGDKLSGRYGDKGVIADVIPDHQMPHDKDGNPFEVLLNPQGLVTRTNPAQWAETMLGKIAKATGKPIKVDDFDDTKDMTEWVMQQLNQHGMSDLDDVIDPNRESKVKDIATGYRFFMKLHHTSEGKLQGRSGGAYTAEGMPAKGGEEGSKRIGMLETNALLSHGATDTLADIKGVRGQNNPEYWMQFMSGYNPNITKVPDTYQKFVDDLKASGVNVVSQGTQTHLLAMTDRDVEAHAGDRELTSAEGVDWNNELKEIPGGLFDKAKTGGHGGRLWSFFKLHEPMPNPALEEPIRRLLGVTGKNFQEILAGNAELPKYGSGPGAIKQALESMNVEKEIEKARAVIASGKKSELDNAVRRLGYLKTMQKHNLKPSDYMMSKVPVLPPAWRPVSMMGNNMLLVSDPNYLYKELFEANKNLAASQKEFGPGGTAQERLAVYNAFKAVTGLGDPISQKSREKNVQGILKSVFGSSPKYGSVQRKLISTTVDNVGRAVITPNPDLDMDSVGLPEDKAFKIYDRFVTRRLVRQGMSMREAREHIADKSNLARRMLVEEMDDRPVYITRAPALHKFSILAMKPRLTKGSTMQLSPLVVKGFNADFDGDAMNFHVPSTEKAKQEALEKLLPSRNLFSLADFKSPMHMPANEYVAGLYHGTSTKSDKPVRIFRTVADVKKALAANQLSMTDRIQVLEA